MMRSGWWLASLLVMVPVAQAQDWEAWQQQATHEEMAAQAVQAEVYRSYHLRLAEALAAEDSARALAFAAILRGLGERSGDTPPGDAPSRAMPLDPQVEAWRRSASAKAGGDVIANQLLIATAKIGDESLRKQAAGRWRDADPGNLVPLLFMDLPPEELLAQARRARRADARMYEGVRWMAGAYRRHPPTAAEQAALGGGESFALDEFAALQAMGMWVATAVPGYMPLMQACRDDASRSSPTRIADCRHVASLLAGPDASAADQGTGLALLHDLADSDAERADIEARQRRMHWQMLQWGRIAQEQPRHGAGQFVRLLGDPSIRTEQQLVERVLQEAGVPLDPPEGWVPPRQ